MPHTIPEVIGPGDEDGGSGDTHSQEEVTDQSQEPEPPPEPPRNVPFDAMRNEPLLTNVLVDNYDGETDERGFLHGYGTAYFKGGNVYTGQFVNGLMHGKGKHVWNDKTVYEGDFYENQLYGNGTFIWTDGSYFVGDVKEGLRHGKGSFQCSSLPCSYSGMWSNGKREGQGYLKYDADGVSYYDGNWCENQRDGYGTRRYASGNMYEGEWKNNVRHGQGTMHWYDTNQMYSGQWLNGVQHGYGEHTWFLRRIKGSQYPLRNRYVGNFVNGLRHDFGVFYYANGARYEGEWLNNTKHGKGVFVFKNGMVFKGLFDSDHMLEYPDINPSGMITPDITAAGLPVRPCTPIATASTMSGDWVTGLDLSLNNLFEKRTIDLDQREMEIQQVHYVFLQYISKLKEIYAFYSAIGSDTSLDNTSAMTKIQFCRFLKDCKIHHFEISIPGILRLIAEEGKPAHDPWANMLMRDFLTALATIAYHIFSDEAGPDNQLLLPWCTSKLVMQNILNHTPCVGGVIFSKVNIALELAQYFPKIYGIFQHLSKPKSSNGHYSMKMRQFLLMVKEYKLLKQDLTAEEVIKILASDHPQVIQDEFIILEIEISFLEFLEALVCCAMVYVKNMVFGDSPVPKDSRLGSSHTPRSAVSTVQPVESPGVDSRSRVSSQSVLITSQDKPTDREQSPTAGDLASATKPVGIPLVILQASSTDDPQPIIIAEDHPANAGQEIEDEHINGEPFDQGHELQNQSHGEEKGSDLDAGPTVDYFGLKMSYFFNAKFFPAADKQKLLDAKTP